MTKNGLPPVFSRTSRASGAASAAERWTVSATSRSTASPASGGEGDLPHDGAAGTELVERRRQRLRGWDLVAAGGADEQHVPGVRVGRQIGHQVRAGGVHPLQIVEEEGERVVRAREGADELADHHAQPVLGVAERQRGRLGLRARANDQLDLGQEVDDQPAVGPQRVEDAAPPGRDLIGALGEDVERELTERADDREVGDVALAPLELRRQEEPLPSNDRPAELVHHRGLSDAGRARDQHELGLPRRDHALEGLPQRCALRFAPVHGLRNQEAVGGVLRPERERRDGARLAPLPETPLEIALQAGRALIPVVGDLGEQLENDLRQHGRQRVAEPRRGRRLPGHVTVHPADRVAGREREPAGEQLIVGDAERVQIGSTVDGAVHAPGLLGRDIREGLLEQALRARGGLLARHPRGGAEVGDLDPAGLGIEEDAARVEVLVNEPAAVDVPDRGRHRDREREKVLDRRAAP